MISLIKTDFVQKYEKKAMEITAKELVLAFIFEDLLLFQHHLECAPAALFDVDFLALCKGFLQSGLIMTNREQLQILVVFEAEAVVYGGFEFVQLGFVAIETEGKHQGGRLDHVGMDSQFVADAEEDLKVMLIHEREVARRDADQRLVVFYDVGGYTVVFGV